VPNFALLFGYTATSWTLKADLAARYFCRLLEFMEKRGYDVAQPHLADPEAMPKLPMLNLSSGYVQRSIDALPKQGPHHPWAIHQDYLMDRKILLRDPLPDGVLQFSRLAPVTARDSKDSATAQSLTA
jgi:hypothetical protein